MLTITKGHKLKLILTIQVKALKRCTGGSRVLEYLLALTMADPASTSVWNSPKHWASPQLHLSPLSQLLWEQQIWFNSTNWPVMPLMTTVSLIKHLMPPNSHFEPIKAGERQIIKQLSYKTQSHLAAAHFPNCRIIKHKTWLFIRIKGMEKWFCCLAKRHCHPYGYLCWIPAQPELQVCNIPSCRRDSLEEPLLLFWGLSKTIHKGGFFAFYVSQIPACIIWSQTNPTKPTHSMLLTAHFSLIYILKSPPTHDHLC